MTKLEESKVRLEEIQRDLDSLDMVEGDFAMKWKQVRALFLIARELNIMGEK